MDRDIVLKDLKILVGDKYSNNPGELNALNPNDTEGLSHLFPR